MKREGLRYLVALLSTYRQRGSKRRSKQFTVSVFLGWKPRYPRGFSSSMNGLGRVVRVNEIVLPKWWEI